MRTPVLQAIALAAAMLFAGAASAQSQTPTDTVHPRPAVTENQPMGTASPATAARAESVKRSIERGAHDVGSKIRGAEHRMKGDSASNRRTPEAVRSNRNAARSNATRSSESGMDSASFRRAMSQCTSNEDMTARANCARDAVQSHGGSAG